jgi:hypothetical protein
MNGLNKFIFWFSVIVLTFMPFGIIMSFALLLLYYGVPYIKSELKDDCTDEYTVEVEYDYANNIESVQKEQVINEFSDDTLEEMK